MRLNMREEMLYNVEVLHLLNLLFITPYVIVFYYERKPKMLNGILKK